MALKDLFRLKTEKDSFVLPMSGKIVALEEVPDPVFAQKMMGDGFAIEPAEGKLYAPVKGKVISIFPTKHAIGLLSDDGLELLIHIGMDTVALNGKGFKLHVREGDRVKPKDLLISIDFEQVKDNVPSLITPVIFTNLQDKTITLKKTGMANFGDSEILEIS